MCEFVCVFGVEKPEIGYLKDDSMRAKNDLKNNKQMWACRWRLMEKIRNRAIKPKVPFLLLTSWDVNMSVLYLECDIFILPLTSTFASVRRVGDIQGERLDSQPAHHYLLCPIDDK